MGGRRDIDDRSSEIEAKAEAEAEVDRRSRDSHVATRMFLSVGAAVGTMSLIYLFTGDDAGQMMLGVTSLLGLVCGVFLFRHRLVGAPTPEGERPERGEPQYLPHASIWPFWIGTSAFLLANGLILGTWFLVPGGVLLVVGVAGFIRQSRARSAS